MVFFVEAGLMPPLVAIGFGVATASLQYLLAPILIDLSLSWTYDMTWVRPEELPAHLRSFVALVCEGERMRFPGFGLIRRRRRSGRLQACPHMASRLKLSLVAADL